MLSPSQWYPMQPPDYEEKERQEEARDKREQQKEDDRMENE